MESKSGKYVLKFFNEVKEPENIVKRIKDDPKYGLGSKRAYGVRLSLVTRILAEYHALPSDEFEYIKQIDNIDGVFYDTFQ